MKPKLLVTELWGLGDLVIATPFLRAASARYDVTLMAKPYALDLRPRFWPEVKVHPFIAPWTAFRGKYRLWRWPWTRLYRLLRLRKERFDIGLSARWDPRDHVLLWAAGARRRMGYARIRSQMFLTDPQTRPSPLSHRYESWRTLARALDLELPEANECFALRPNRTGGVLIHSGAGQPVRVWPLAKYRDFAQRLRAGGIRVTLACDPDQRAWWEGVGEMVAVPRTVEELLHLLDCSAAFLGNDSGPAHLAAASGLPTFTLFGPQLPEWFAPLGSASTCLEGKPCPYKPCSDYCRFPMPYCLVNVTEAEAWEGFVIFIRNAMGVDLPSPANQDPSQGVLPGSKTL